MRVEYQAMGSIKENGFPTMYPDHIDAYKHKITPHFVADEDLHTTEVLNWIYGKLAFQYGELMIIAKAYIDQPHGQKEIERLGTIRATQWKDDLNRLQSEAEEQLVAKTIPSVSGVFYDKRNNKYVIPMCDLEITATGDDKSSLKNDLDNVLNIFQSKGIPGHILRSGDINVGSYHFIGEQALPYEPYFWWTMGLFMAYLTNGSMSDKRTVSNRHQCENLGYELMCCESIEQARIVATKIDKAFPSISSGQRRNGLYIDPRYIMHRINQGINTLARPTGSKNYREPPKHVIEFY